MHLFIYLKKVYVGAQYIFFFLILFIYLFIIYFWLCRVFVSVRGLPLVAASGGHSSSRCTGLWLSWPLLLWSTGSRRAGSVVVAHGPSCSAVCGIFPDQGSNPCPLHWQADSQPLCHREAPVYLNILVYYYIHNNSDSSHVSEIHFWMRDLLTEFEEENKLKWSRRHGQSWEKKL